MKLSHLANNQPAQRQAVDPQKAREALLRFLGIVAAENEAGQLARDALHRLAVALRDLLQLLGGHEL